LAITGAEGLPKLDGAGNVIRGATTLRCSMRLPPTMNPQKAEEILREKLTKDVPNNAKITIKGGHTGSGWCMKTLTPGLDGSIKKAGKDFFDDKETLSFGIGGSIPFLSELEKMYPTTEIVALGLLGPDSNAHAPNEMINLAYAKKLTCALAHMIQECA